MAKSQKNMGVDEFRLIPLVACQLKGLESLFIFLVFYMFYPNPQVLELEKSDEVASHQ